jgi:peptide/nickel transport system permease protein
MASAAHEQSPGNTESGMGEIVRRLKRQRSLAVGLTILLVIAAAAILAPLIAPYDPYATDIVNRRVPPIWFHYLYDDLKATWDHVLGTDKLGRDYLSRLIYGARISLTIGICVVTISAFIGATLGICAGYFGGLVDSCVMYVVTTRLALPVILVALAVVALYGSSYQIIIFVLGFLLWDRFAVVLRTATIQVRSMEYVAAAQAIGSSTFTIIRKEVLPNVLNSFVVIATIELANAILYEAALSFLGMGVQPPLPSWGLMLAEGKEDIFFSPWVITIPGLAIFTLILAVNLLGDGLRDLSSSR